jgi:hypothetical protein
MTDNTLGAAIGVTLVILFVLYYVWQLNRPTLSCGCPDDGRAIIGCLACGHTRCENHRFTSHGCQAARR